MFNDRRKLRSRENRNRMGKGGVADYNPPQEFLGLTIKSVADPGIYKPGARYNFWDLEIVLMPLHTYPMLLYWE